MKEHQSFKTLEVVERVGGPIIKLGLGHSKLWWDAIIHDLGGERRVSIELCLERAGRSDLEGLELTVHIIDLASEVDSFQVGRKEGSVVVRGLDSEPRAGRTMRFRALVVLRIFQYRSNWGWWQQRLMHLRGSGSRMQDGLL